MKRAIILLALATYYSSVAQSVIEISGNIATNTVWNSSNIYLLKTGCTNIIDNAILTIEPGTIIKAEQFATLIITQGAQIRAEGTPNQPIVFTSAKPIGQRSPGDWNGVAICGKAPLTHLAPTLLLENDCQSNLTIIGGNDPNDNSGTIKYCRIEFAGQWGLSTQNGYGLTLGAVGDATVIEHVQVSHCAKDGFRFLGGTVNGRWLASNRPFDDMVDISNGYRGKIQWLVGVNDNIAGDPSGVHGIESSTTNFPVQDLPETDNAISNISLFGPQLSSEFSFVSRCGYFEKCTETDVFNSVAANFAGGLKIDECAQDHFVQGELVFESNLFAGIPILFWDWDTIGFTLLEEAFFANGNDTIGLFSGLQAGTPYSVNPDFRPGLNAPSLDNANFSNAILTDGFFTEVPYKGAFGETDWTDCWTVWNPQFEDYDNPPISYPLPTINSLEFTQNGKVVLFSAETSGATDYLWDFGDGQQASEVSPAHLFSPGSYDVVLTVNNSFGCSTTSTIQVDLTSSDQQAHSLGLVKAAPNPFTDGFWLYFDLEAPQTVHIGLIDQLGRSVYRNAFNLASGAQQVRIDGINLQGGIYALSLQTANRNGTIKLQYEPPR